MRLFDENRQKIKVGDTIVFANIVTHEELFALVVSLERYPDFFELYKRYDKEAIGYSKDEVANPNDMYAYYAKERIEKYGSLAIGIKTITK